MLLLIYSFTFNLLLCSECKIIATEESSGVGKNTLHRAVSLRQRGFLDVHYLAVRRSVRGVILIELYPIITECYTTDVGV